MSQQDMDRQDGVFAAALGYQLASEDIDLLLWLHAEKVWQVEQVEASRRDWAAEAEYRRREAEFEALGERYDHDADTLSCQDPRCPQRFVGLRRFAERGEHLTTAHPELLDPDYDEQHRECATAGGVCIHHVGPPSLPHCAVHPEADRAGEVDRG